MTLLLSTAILLTAFSGITLASIISYFIGWRHGIAERRAEKAESVRRREARAARLRREYQRREVRIWN
jgi:membrane protein DedA with SNARE-associated domain